MRAWPGPDVPALPGQGLPLRLYDSATEQVRPTSPGPVASLYVCGITPYDATHLGHAATYVTFDLVQRVWRDGGHAVRYVQNVTDVDDPLLERAAQLGVPWEQIAQAETERFRGDMTVLRVLPPDVFLGAVETIPLIVDAVEQLREYGAAYELDGDIYFSVAADPLFGAVAHLDRPAMLALSAERGGDPGRPGKKDPLDPLLWRAHRPGEPSWPSPLGAGRPGWHIECATMALTHLGPTIDVQGGGRDLTFPHHEMGASHAHCLTGRPFARHYVHAAMVGLDGQKMSKSVGNLVFVSKLREQGHAPAAIRLALLAHHYRTDWEWTEGGLAEAEQRLGQWRAAVARPEGPPAETLLADVRRLLADDLQTPAALAAIDRWVHEQLTRGGADAGSPGLVARLADALLGVEL